MELLFLEVLMWAFKVEDLHRIAPYKLGFLVVILGLLFISWRTHRRVRKVGLDACNSGQGRIVFQMVSELHRHKIEDFFYRNSELLGITKTVNDESILNKYDYFFKTLLDTGVDELSHFTLDSRPLSDFLNGCSSDYMEMKMHLLEATLSENEQSKKDASFFLKRRFDSINAEFGLWLKIKQKGIK